MDDGRNEGEERIENNQGSQRGQIPFVLSIDIVPDHVSRTQQEVHESTLRIIVEERDAVEGPFVKVPLPGLGLMFRPRQ